jgi:hypothetical protein
MGYAGPLIVAVGAAICGKRIRAMNALTTGWGSGMNPKYVLYSAIVAGGAIGPAALVNGEILDNQCEVLPPTVI